MKQNNKERVTEDRSKQKTSRIIETDLKASSLAARVSKNNCLIERNQFIMHNAHTHNSYRMYIAAKETKVEAKKLVFSLLASFISTADPIFHTFTHQMNRIDHIVSTKI